VGFSGDEIDEKAKPLASLAVAVPFGSSAPEPNQIFNVDKPASAPQPAGKKSYLYILFCFMFQV
jgi:hypothetical protein